MLKITNKYPQTTMDPLRVSLGGTEISKDTEQKNEPKSLQEHLLILGLQKTDMFMPSFPVP